MSEMGRHMPNRCGAKIWELIMVCHASQWPMRTMLHATQTCGVCKDARREATMPAPRPHIDPSLCHAMGWLGEDVSHFTCTSLCRLWVAAPDLG